MSDQKDKAFGRFLEIEHKFLVPADFAKIDFAARVSLLRPTRTTDVRQVRDTYYVSKSVDSYVFRHRYDEELQHLTAKQAKVAYTRAENHDNEVRQEINLLLSQENGDQDVAVQTFLQTLGAEPIGCIYKDIQVYYFSDCEVCLYKATLKNSSKPPVYCVEFEAKNYSDETEALEILFRYEKSLGFDANKREKHNLFDIFFKDALATHS